MSLTTITAWKHREQNHPTHATARESRATAHRHHHRAVTPRARDRY
jgi:hypothetical protein